eukprot:5394028-Prymnesium_polylepis.1
MALDRKVLEATAEDIRGVAKVRECGHAAAPWGGAVHACQTCWLWPKRACGEWRVSPLPRRAARRCGTCPAPRFAYARPWARAGGAPRHRRDVRPAADRGVPGRAHARLCARAAGAGGWRADAARFELSCDGRAPWRWRVGGGVVALH